MIEAGMDEVIQLNTSQDGKWIGLVSGCGVPLG